jgi:hypothetical protein
MSDTQQWDDIYMRDNFGDTGEVPCKSPGWTSSPDIIPNGVNLLSDPVKYLKDNWDKDVGQQTVLNQQNYFYVRAKNLFNGERKGTFKVYYCPQHLFLFPSLWSEGQLKTSSGIDFVSATAQKIGDLVIPDEPFTLPPSESEEHHCMIAQVITDGHPNPLPPAGSIADTNALAKFILDHPNYVWRNISLVKKDIPTFTHNFGLESGNEDSQIMFQLECKNITPGSFVAFSCGTPIPSGTDKGKLIKLQKTEVTQPNIALGTITLNIPKNFNTTISYSYWAKTPVQEGWKVSFKAIVIQNPGDELYGHIHAKPLTEFGMEKDLMTESDALAKGILLGSVHTQGQ